MLNGAALSLRPLPGHLSWICHSNFPGRVGGRYDGPCSINPMHCIALFDRLFRLVVGGRGDYVVVGETSGSVTPMTIRPWSHDQPCPTPPSLRAASPSLQLF